MARRKRGSIDVRERADGPTAYVVRWEVAPDPDTGRRRQRSVTVYDAREADELLTAKLAEVDAGIDVAPSADTLAEVAQRWLAEEAAPGVRPTTLDRYRIEVGHVERRLGAKKAQALTPADVSAFRAKLAKEASPRTAHGAMLRLRQILEWATELELVKRNVAARVGLPKYAPGERRPLTHAEARQFLEQAASDFYWPAWLVFLTTGFRRGELLGLRWRDVDLSPAGRGTLSVRQIVVQCGNALTIQEPKTDASRRTIDIDGRTVDALRTHREKVGGGADSLVFRTATGGPLDPGSLRDHLGDLCGLVGVEGVRIHDLRHTHATHLLLAGVPLAVVSKRLGHSKTSVTLDVYSHVLPGYSGAALDAIESIFFAGAEGARELARELDGAGAGAEDADGADFRAIASISGDGKRAERDSPPVG